jgi:hypothetical protein
MRPRSPRFARSKSLTERPALAARFGWTFVVIGLILILAESTAAAPRTEVARGAFAHPTSLLASCIPMTTPPCLDLVADGHYDSMGLPLNPRWGLQHAPFESADPSQLCVPLFILFTSAINPACTSQRPSYDGVSSPFSGAWPIGTRVACGGGVAAGHSDWGAATYTGRIYFEDHSSAAGGDDDYTWQLATPDGRGSLSGNAGGTIHPEFDSDETIDHFITPWWSKLHDLVGKGEPYSGVHFFVDGSQAIVTGLAGIDWVHSPGTELHPVYALFVKEPSTLQSSTYAFFVRNWGNEGACSGDDHNIIFYPNGVYRVKIDWPRGARGVSGIGVSARAGYENNPFLYPSFGRIYPDIVHGVGVYFSFVLPDPGLRPFYEGEISVGWKGAPQAAKLPPPPPCRSTHSCHERGDEPEKVLEKAIDSLLTRRQKAAITARIHGRIRRDYRLSPSRIHVRSISRPPTPAKARRPRTFAPFDRKQARRRKLQRRLICNAVGGVVPSIPIFCFNAGTVLHFEDQPNGTEIGSQYARRGLTFTPPTSTDTRAPRVIRVGPIQASDGSKILRAGECFSPSCEFGTRYVVNGAFTAPRAGVAMFVGALPKATAMTVSLKAYAANNVLIGERNVAVSPNRGVHTPLVVNSKARDITRFVMSGSSEFGVDEVAF